MAAKAHEDDTRWQEFNIDNISEASLRYMQEKIAGLLDECKRGYQTEHTLRSKLDAANRTLADYCAEHEALSAELDKLSANRTQPNESDKWRAKCREIESEREQLEERLRETNSTLESLQHQQASTLRAHECALATLQATQTDDAERIASLQAQNAELLTKLQQQDDARETQGAELRLELSKLNEMSETIDGLRDSLEAKQEQIREKDEQIEVLEERVAELASGNFGQAVVVPSDTATKGNSLFGELDDQRQIFGEKCKQLYKIVQQLRREKADQEAELSNLARDRSTMLDQIAEVQRYFCNSHCQYVAILNKQVADLHSKVAEMSRAYGELERDFKESNNVRGTSYVNSIMENNKRECAALQSKIQSLDRQVVSAEKRMHVAQQEKSRWHFEALLRRIIIADRELLLKEHNIPYQEVKWHPQRLREKSIEDSEPCFCRPDIAEFSAQKSTKAVEPINMEAIEASEAVQQEAMEELLNECKTQAVIAQLKPPTADSKPLAAEHMAATIGHKATVHQKSSNADQQPEVDSKPLADDTKSLTPQKSNASTNTKTSPAPAMRKRLLSSDIDENIENKRPKLRGTPVKTLWRRQAAGKSVEHSDEVDDEPKLTVTTDGTQQQRSILSSQRDILAEPNPKSVTFSQAAPTVHKISPTGGAAGAGEQQAPPAKRVTVRHIVVPSRNRNKT